MGPHGRVHPGQARGTDRPVSWSTFHWLFSSRSPSRAAHRTLLLRCVVLVNRQFVATNGGTLHYMVSQEKELSVALKWCGFGWGGIYEGTIIDLSQGADDAFDTWDKWINYHLFHRTLATRSGWKSFAEHSDSNLRKESARRLLEHTLFSAKSCRLWKTGTMAPIVPGAIPTVRHCWLFALKEKKR